MGFRQTKVVPVQSHNSFLNQRSQKPLRDFTGASVRTLSERFVALTSTIVSTRFLRSRRVDARASQCCVEQRTHALLSHPSQWQSHTRVEDAPQVLVGSFLGTKRHVFLQWKVLTREGEGQSKDTRRPLRCTHFPVVHLRRNASVAVSSS